MPKVHKRMVPPLFSGATGGKRQNLMVTWPASGACQSHHEADQYTISLSVSISCIVCSVLVKNTEQELWDMCGEQIY